MKNKKHVQTLTRSNIKDAFCQKMAISQDTANTLLESILLILTSMILQGPSVKIVSFGTFLLHTKKERMGRNPKTKASAVISARKSISFRPSTYLRHQVCPPTE